MNSASLAEQRAWIVLSLFLILAGLAVEIFSLSGVYSGAAFTVAVLITLFSGPRAVTILVAITSFIAIVVSFFFLHGSEDSYTVIVNHSWSVGGVMAALFFVLYVKNFRDKAEEDNVQINSLISLANEGIILTNRAGEIVMVNPFAVSMFGYFKDELIGRKIEMLIPESMRGEHVQHREDYHARPSNRPMGLGKDLYARRKDASIFPVEVSLSHYNLGRESYVIAFITDITIRKRDEEMVKKQNAELERISSEVRKLNSELEQKVEDRTMMLRETLVQLERSKNELSGALEKEKELGDLKSRFVSTVSHEFRTPLSAILSSASLLAKYIGPDDQPKRDRHIVRIKESVRHMNTMLEDLLSLGRLEEGLIESKPQTFDLKKFMHEFLIEMNEIAKPGQRVVYTTKGDMIVTLDKRLLKNVLMNLVSNAIKFSPEDSMVEILCANESGVLTVSVSDHGIGISEEDQEHLFQRFFRARNAVNVQGTGLGLHIVLKYLELMNGKISLHSKLNEGSTFTISVQSE